jgi:hypothetical protein
MNVAKAGNRKQNKPSAKADGNIKELKIVLILR